MENQNEPIFTKERYEYFKSKGLTDEQIKTLERAEVAADSLQYLPDDIQSVYNEIEALPDDPAARITALNEMAQSDPDKFARIMSLINAVDLGME